MARRHISTFREYLEHQATKSSQDLVADIDSLIKDIFRYQENPEGISTTLLKLTVKNAGLGNFLIEALDEERTADTLYKWTVDGRKLELMGKQGMSATQAESTAKVESQEMLVALNATRKAVDILKVKRADVDKIIDAARSRLSLIKQDLRNQ